MFTLNLSEAESVVGGMLGPDQEEQRRNFWDDPRCPIDRWGDGQDQKNHPDPSVISEVCTKVDNPANGSGWEICVELRTR